MEDFLHHINSGLGPKEVRQFEKAIAQPMGEFHKRVISPQFYQPGERMYLGLAVDKYVEGRNHRVAMKMREMPDAWHALTYFTNPLALPPAPTIVEGGKMWVSPKDRVIWGRSQVMTFEFDQPDLDFFRTQLAWCRSGTGKLLDSQMGHLYRACSQWIDFEGITVCYSGNKSFHIHIVFDTGHARSLGIEQNIRHGLNLHWHKLLETVMQNLQPGVNPDDSMWQPEKFRRIPNGVRELEKQNILGIPAGNFVPQATIWEKFRDRTSKTAQTVFFDPMLFVKPAVAPTSRTSSSLTFLPSGPELDYCRTKMREMFNEQCFPAFHDFVEHEGTIRAHFANHIGDRKPSSYMDADYRTVNICGSNALGLSPSTAPRMPKPLGEMMASWCDEFQHPNARERIPVESDFAMAVKDDASARTEMAKLLTRVIKNEKLALICAPEGISKTTGLFENHCRIAHWLKAQDDGAIMYAFADYRGAYDKVREFNERQSDGAYRAIVLESFEQTYGKACEKLHIKQMGLKQLAESGHSSLLVAIEAMQPAVIETFQAWHTDLWAEVGDAIPVFFTVHAVAHNWPLSAPSRLMWAPSYWKLRGQPDHAKTCRDETRLSLLVHDEIRAEDIVAAFPAWKVDWVQAMVAHNAAAWRKGSAAVTRQSAFSDFLRQVPPEKAISYEEVQDIMRFDGHEWDKVTTRDSGEYGGLKGNYANAIGNDWRIIERHWPVEAANRSIVLTTETVPMHLARRSAHDWAIFDLDTPLIKADFVETHLQRGVTGKNLAKLCMDWRRTEPDIAIVSNKVAHLPNTMTHAGARGSNSLIGKDILQTMTFVTPGELERLEALNAWTGLDCLIRHRHIDEFNQTAGRNLGFRKRGNVRHYLLVNKALFELLAGAPKARARYEMRVVPNRSQRRQGRGFKTNSAAKVSKLRLNNLRIKMSRDRAAEQSDPLVAMAA
jgi:hypothetical protein